MCNCAFENGRVSAWKTPELNAELPQMMIHEHPGEFSPFRWIHISEGRVRGWKRLLLRKLLNSLNVFCAFGFKFLFRNFSFRLVFFRNFKVVRKAWNDIQEKKSGYKLYRRRFFSRQLSIHKGNVQQVAMMQHFGRIHRSPFRLAVQRKFIGPVNNFLRYGFFLKIFSHNSKVNKTKFPGNNLTKLMKNYGK